MFFRLPFPDISRMEKLHLSMKISADVISFLGDMEDDLKQPRAMDDLRRGWKDFLETETTSSGCGQHNLGKSSQCKRRERNKTPTSSEDSDAGSGPSSEAGSGPTQLSRTRMEPPAVEGSSSEAQVCLL